MAKSRAPRPVTIRAPSDTVGPRIQPGSTRSIPSSRIPRHRSPLSQFASRALGPSCRRFSPAPPRPRQLPQRLDPRHQDNPSPSTPRATRRLPPFPARSVWSRTHLRTSSRVWPVVRRVEGTHGSDPWEPISRTSISGWQIRRSRASVCPHGTRLSPRLPTRSKGVRDHSFRAAGLAGRRVFVSPAGHPEADSHGGVAGCGCTGGLDAGGVPAGAWGSHGGF